MNRTEQTLLIKDTVERLADQSSFPQLFSKHEDGDPIPSGKILEEIVDLCRSLLFPGYFGNPSISNNTVVYHIGVTAERLLFLLTDQIQAGLLFGCEKIASRKEDRKCCISARELAVEFVQSLPEIRRMLATDVLAAYNGDPAATCMGEIVCCYPAIRAISNYRIAHVLYRLGVPLIPRMITEMAHSETGIDIHPGAEIGEYFSIDHGTGIVIGQTCIIGNHVSLYQGVTLGARSFPTDENGNPVKGIPRHPIIEDNVTIYSNATILGRITIGKGAVIGGNIWVTEDVEPGGRRVQRR